MQNLNEVIFYTMDGSIRAYRQFAQRNIDAAGLDLTVDQWLIMNVVDQNQGLRQYEIAEKVFKDAASVTRIIDAMIRKGYLRKYSFKGDRRRSSLVISPPGKKIIQKARTVIGKYRSVALHGLSKKQIEQVRRVLDKIRSNCLE